MVKNVRIVRRKSGRLRYYETRLPVPEHGVLYSKDGVSLMEGLAQVMASDNSLSDPNRYGLWYGKDLGMSKKCKKGLESIVNLRNRVLGITA